MKVVLVKAGIAASIFVTALAPAGAATVSFTGTVANLCVLTLSTPGVLSLSTDGKTLSSTESGGVKAVMAVVAAGSNPTIQLSAPTIAGPSDSTSTANTSIAYTSLSGASQPFTSGTSSHAMTRLLDTLTIDGKSENAGGFAAGTYTITSTATCQQ